MTMHKALQPTFAPDFMEKIIYKTAIVSIILVCFVVVAGSIVRVTGSGMGCPDWPKCFGYTIPPTSTEQVEWHPNKTFNEGNMIIKDESLLLSLRDFTTGAEFDAANWEVYDKHDYAIFNPVHTWIEFLNRLSGGLSGMPVTILFVLCTIYAFRRKKWRLFFLAGFAMVMLGFVAWLGKIVVDGNLLPGHISYHMLGALAIVLFLLLIMTHLLPKSEKVVSNQLKWVALGCLVLGLAQITFGTQVREDVDTLIKAGVARDGWMDGMDVIFFVHRSFSLLLVLLNGYLWWKLRGNEIYRKPSNLLMAFVVGGIILGVLLAYGSMPPWAQPLHLWLAFAMFSAHVWILGRMMKKPQLSL
jgi:cytochrome c oxidase assembly protein subunit 15